MFLTHCADVSYVLIFGMVKVLAPSFSPAMFTRVFFLQNLPADALPDGPVREKMANFKRPKKFKTSENDFSHGSFFLRIGGISKSIHFDLIIYRNKAWISFKFLVN